MSIGVTERPLTHLVNYFCLHDVHNLHETLGGETHCQEVAVSTLHCLESKGRILEVG